ncbi:hypothetical protein DRN73_07190 [Candidatus Pacearchaeota archaeon]|nr:MAG: hypothetical protein DRN73_07190 [Candidatus Pacearchaeota archaeon]
MNFEYNQTLWISHSAISDFEDCPRLYYFKNVYRSPITNHRVQIANPYLSLGSAVHQAIEEVNILPKEQRLNISLIERFERIWKEYQGKKGGFATQDQEEEFKERGRKMLKRIEQNPRIIKSSSYQFRERLPKVKLFKDKDIILTGAVDWIEILPSGGLHIIDFKTGRNKENNSLQLPIYLILANYNLNKPVEKVSYWYLENDDAPISIDLNPIQYYIPIIREKALEIEKAIKEKRFFCKSGYRNCFKCREYETIISGQAEYVGYDEKMRKDLYFINK